MLTGTLVPLHILFSPPKKIVIFLYYNVLLFFGGGLDLLVNGLREYEQWYKSEGYKYDDVLRLKA